MDPMSSAVDQAIRALVAVIRAAVPEGTQVLDGPSTERPEGDTIVVGYEDAAAVVQRTNQDPYGGRCTELGDIISVISCWDGETDVAAKRKKVLGYLALIEGAIRDNPTLTCEEFPDGAVDEAAIGDTGELVQRQSSGALAALGFSVSYRAFI